MTLHRRATDPFQAIRRTALSALTLSLATTMTAGGSVGAQSPIEGPGQEPGLCLRADRPTADSTWWAEVGDAVLLSVRAQPDFFPNPTVVSLPEAKETSDPATSHSHRIGVWNGDVAGQIPVEAKRERLASAACGADGADWSGAISRELLLAGAERILAAAKLPDESGEVLIPEGSTTHIDVEFHPADRLVRTILDFVVDIGFGVTISGTCWIDDVLGVDEGQVVASSATDMDVSPFGDRACGKFQRFMTEGGAGERATTMLPTTILLSDGSIWSFETAAVGVDATTITLSGVIERQEP